MHIQDGHSPLWNSHERFISTASVIQTNRFDMKSISGVKLTIHFVENKQILNVPRRPNSVQSDMFLDLHGTDRIVASLFNKTN